MFPGTAATAQEACAVDSVWVRTQTGVSAFSVEIADTNETRARGLMFREHLDRDAGMLFVFDPPREVAFWMRNTPLPLDLIYVDAAGVVRKVHEGAVPFSEALMPSGSVVRAVLEVNAGVAAAQDIAPGARMRHPAFGPDAAWPCP